MIDFKSYNISKIHYQIRPLFMSDQLQFIRKCDRIAAFSNKMHVSFAKVGWRNCNSQLVRWSSGKSTTDTNIQKTKENILFYSSYISKLYSICIIKEEKEKTQARHLRRAATLESCSARSAALPSWCGIWVGAKKGRRSIGTLTTIWVGGS